MIPWPYPQPFTTAHSCAGAARDASRAALCAMAPRSTSAQAYGRSSGLTATASTSRTGEQRAEDVLARDDADEDAVAHHRQAGHVVLVHHGGRVLDGVGLLAHDRPVGHDLADRGPESARHLLVEVLVADLERAAEERHERREVHLAAL